jgi:hypothetical protein
MADIIKLALVNELLVSWLLLTVAATREIQETKQGEKTTVARLQDEGGLMECWNALLELKSCTNEIVLFFNGESYLGLDSCRAISLILSIAGPLYMLTSLGYTAEEGNILRDYCGTSSPESARTDLQRICA